MPSTNSSGKSKSRLLPVVVAFIVGVVFILGTQQAISGTDGAAFCGSCHAMSEAVWTHSMSVHAKQACNECHTPHAIATKLPFKAQIGLHDIYVNTTGNVPDDIQASKSTKDVIQANCVRCHYATIRDVNMTTKQYCTDCHRSVPHMNKLPIDRRKAADV